jgi:hypothetical protein
MTTIDKIPYTDYVSENELNRILEAPAVKKFVKTSDNSASTISNIFGDTLLRVLQLWTVESKKTYIEAITAFLPVIDVIKNDYPEIFVLNTNKYSSLYRGTNLDSNKLKSFIETTDKTNWKPVKLKNGLTFMVYFDKQFAYKPHRKMQSWSTNNDRAAEFGEAIVIVDTKKGKYLMNPDYFHNISKQQDNEFETINIGSNLKVWVGIEKEWFEDLIKNN